MNAPQTIYAFRWLMRDTFRQATASGIFWLMLGVSLMCILVCLSVRVVGDENIHAEGEVVKLTTFDVRRTALDTVDTVAAGATEVSGVWRIPSSTFSREYREVTKALKEGFTGKKAYLELAFGALQVDIERDRHHAVRAFQLKLAGWVADAAGLLLALMWTAGFLPAFLDPAAVSVLLAKPVSRGTLLAGKFLGVLAFVAFQAAFFIGGTWLALALKTGVWSPRYFWSVPLLLLHFGVFFSFSAMLAVATRNASICVFGSVVFWLLCWAMNYGRHFVLTSPDLAQLRETSPSFGWIVEAGYWIMPKPLDFHTILLNALEGDNFFAKAVDVKNLSEMGAWHPEISVLASVLTGLVLLGIAMYEFVTADY